MFDRLVRQHRNRPGSTFEAAIIELNCSESTFAASSAYLGRILSRRAKDDAIAREQSDMRVRVDKSLENLRGKMERELEERKLELLEVRTPVEVREILTDFCSVPHIRKSGTVTPRFVL